MDLLLLKSFTTFNGRQSKKTNLHLPYIPDRQGKNRAPYSIYRVPEASYVNQSPKKTDFFESRNPKLRQLLIGLVN